MTAGAELIKNGVEDFAEIGGSGSTAGRKNEEGSDEFPLSIAQVGEIRFARQGSHTKILPNYEKIGKSNLSKMPKLPRPLLYHKLRNSPSPISMLQTAE